MAFTASHLSDVIPAKAGIHLDLALLPIKGIPPKSKAKVKVKVKVKMDPSFRWDDDLFASCASSNLTIALSETQA